MNKSASPAGGFKGKRLLIWMAALVIGAVLGTLGINWLDELCNFIASIYTRLFKFIAVPTIALAITTTLATLGTQKDTGKIFKYTIVYTLLTTLVAAVMGAVLYKVIAPGNLPVEAVRQGAADVPQNLKAISVYDHILAVVPDNVLLPFSSGNVLSILLVSAALGLALAALKDSANVQILTKAVLGFQEVLFALIRALVWAHHRRL